MNITTEEMQIVKSLRKFRDRNNINEIKEVNKIFKDINYLINIERYDLVKDKLNSLIEGTNKTIERVEQHEYISKA